MRYAEIIDRSPPSHPFVACVTMQAHDLPAFQTAIQGYPQVRMLSHDAVDAHHVTIRIGCASAELARRLKRLSCGQPQ